MRWLCGILQVDVPLRIPDRAPERAICPPIRQDLVVGRIDVRGKWMDDRTERLDADDQYGGDHEPGQYGTHAANRSPDHAPLLPTLRLPRRRLGRPQGDPSSWWRRHDEYGKAPRCGCS